MAINKLYLKTLLFIKHYIYYVLVLAWKIYVILTISTNIVNNVAHTNPLLSILSLPIVVFLFFLPDFIFKKFFLKKKVAISFFILLSSILLAFSIIWFFLNNDSLLNITLTIVFITTLIISISLLFIRINRIFFLPIILILIVLPGYYYLINNSNHILNDLCQLNKLTNINTHNLNKNDILPIRDSITCINKKISYSNLFKRGYIDTSHTSVKKYFYNYDEIQDEISPFSINDINSLNHFRNMYNNFTSINIIIGNMFFFYFIFTLIYHNIEYSNISYINNVNVNYKSLKFVTIIISFIVAILNLILVLINFII